MTLSVKVIIRDSAGRVLVIRRSPASKGNAGKWEFPGGKVDPGEAFDVALLREVHEETGLTISLERPFEANVSTLRCRKVVYLIMEGLTLDTSIRLSSEHDRFRWVGPDEFDEIPFSPQFRRVARRYARHVSFHLRPLPHTTRAEPEDPFEGSVVNPTNLTLNLQEFKAGERDRKELSNALREFLVAGVKGRIPTAQVDTRSKDLISFARKLIQKNKYKEPGREVTDLIGGRIIVHLPSEVQAVGAWIESQFEVDRVNSVDKLKDLGPDKFGYRSVHYVVVLRDAHPAGLRVPRALEGVKAELQVRTIAQHAWSDIGHDRIYKADCDIPEYWKREASRIAALLEAADEEFSRLVQGLDAYRHHLRACPDCATTKRQLELWETVRSEAPPNPVVALRVAKLACELEDWARIIDVADEFGENANVELLCLKGFALCQLAEHPHTQGWKNGIGVLMDAAERYPTDLEPRLRLGELWLSHDRAEALRFYSEAFQLDSGQPAVLAGYIRCKLLEEKNTSFLPLLRPEIEEGVRRCRDLIAAGADLPHAIYRIAGFLLLLGPDRGQEALEVLARAVYETQFPDILIHELLDLSALAKLLCDRVDVQCATRFLAAALKARFPNQPWPAGAVIPAAKPLHVPAPVIMVAGGCDAHHESAMKAYGELLTRALEGFRGTIISGGTEQGISGLVGCLTSRSGGTIHSVGYLPTHLPRDKSATEDARYTMIRETAGQAGFTALEPLQAWLDLLAGEVNPEHVRLLGINGGNVAGLEYRIALALGAQVGVIENSGREADRIAKEWIPHGSPPCRCGPTGLRKEGADRFSSAGRLLVLPADPMTIRAFVQAGSSVSPQLAGEAIEQGARLCHEEFLEQQRYAHPDPVMQPWPSLRDDLQQSNRDQIKCVEAMLGWAGFGLRSLAGTPKDPVFTDEEVECMAEMEHGRWNVERLRSGWRYAKEKDASNKLSPHLVPWANLPDDVRKHDRLNVRLWAEILAEVGYEIYRPGA